MDMSRQKPNMIVHFAGKASSCPERFSASHDRDAATHDRSSDFAACRVDRPLTAYATVRNRTDACYREARQAVLLRRTFARHRTSFLRVQKQRAAGFETGGSFRGDDMAFADLRTNCWDVQSVDGLDSIAEQ
jgi:hypothetical protein